jgi:excinuclease ABC subunit A
VRNRTTGVLYVLDEPSIGLHPANIEGLLALVSDLLGDGNSVLLVDHDVQVLRQADNLIEIGPGSGGGTAGGRVVAEGTPEQVAANDDSATGTFLA